MKLKTADQSSSNLNKECTEQAKGLAIILVILSHFAVTKFSYMPLAPFLGTWGVAIFLFLSGYGLAQSYLYKGLDKGFFKKRAYKVLLPYSLVTLVWVLVDALVLNKHYPWRVIISGLLGFDLTRSIDPSMWYITFILLWYISFYLLFKLPIKNLLKLAGLFVIAYIFYFHSGTRLTRHIMGEWRLHAASFPVGVLFGLYLNVFLKAFKKKYLFIFYLLIFVISAYICVIESKLHLAFGYTGAHYAHFYSNIFFAISAVFLFMLLHALKFRIGFFAMIGEISYELYLVEFVFMTKYNVLQIHSKPLALLLYIAIITILSLLLKKLISWVVSVPLKLKGGNWLAG